MKNGTEEHTQESLRALVEGFELRRRATTAEFNVGVRLAGRGAVAFGQLSTHTARGTVRDGDLSHEVELVSRAGTIVACCDCAHALNRICRHQVALAHALWERHQADRT